MRLSEEIKNDNSYLDGSSLRSALERMPAAFNLRPICSSSACAAGTSRLMSGMSTKRRFAPLKGHHNKYSNKDITKYPNKDINKYPNKDITKYPNKDINKYPNKDINKYPNIDINKRTQTKTLTSHNKDIK